MKYILNGLIATIGIALIVFGVLYLNFNLPVMIVGMVISLIAIQAMYEHLKERYESIVKTMQDEALNRQWYISTFPENYANGQLSCCNCNSLAIVEVALPKLNRHYCKKCNHTLFYTPLNQG